VRSIFYLDWQKSQNTFSIDILISLINVGDQHLQIRHPFGHVLFYSLFLNFFSMSALLRTFYLPLSLKSSFQTFPSFCDFINYYFFKSHFYYIEKFHKVSHYICKNAHFHCKNGSEMVLPPPRCYSIMRKCYYWITF
jgi:hypothetical protein